MSKAAVVAGRRIDAKDASDKRFPLENVGIVKRRLEERFAEFDLAKVVSSAACGADLIALMIAIEHRLQVKIVLPYDPTRFLTSSVIDRPGDWGPMFWKAISYAKTSAGLVILNGSEGAQVAYDAVTAELFVGYRADALWTIAIAVWDGECRGDDDATCDFISHAKQSHLDVIHVPTLV